MINNILALAQGVIPPASITYYKQSSKSVNDIGIVTSSYQDGITIKANVHPVSRAVYQEQGLDFNKKYIKVFTQNDMNDLERDKSSDKIKYNGENYQVFNESDWKTFNGWTSFMAVRID